MYKCIYYIIVIKYSMYCEIFNFSKKLVLKMIIYFLCFVIGHFHDLVFFGFGFGHEMNMDLVIYMIGLPNLDLVNYLDLVI